MAKNQSEGKKENTGGRYDTDKLFKDALKIIRDNKFVFHTDIYEYMGISSSTYYDHFPKGSKEYEEISLLLRQNNIKIRSGIRNKWYRDNSAKGSIYLYKLLGNKTERDRLSYSFNKNETKLDADVTTTGTVDLSKLSDSALEEIEKAMVNDQDFKSRG